MSEVQAKAWLDAIIAEAAEKATRVFGLSSQEEGRRKLYQRLRVTAKACFDSRYEESVKKAQRVFGLSSREEGVDKLTEGLRRLLENDDDSILAAVRDSK